MEMPKIQMAYKQSLSLMPITIILLHNPLHDGMVLVVQGDDVICIVVFGLLGFMVLIIARVLVFQGFLVVLCVVVVPTFSGGLEFAISRAASGRSTSVII